MAILELSVFLDPHGQFFHHDRIYFHVVGGGVAKLNGTVSLYRCQEHTVVHTLR